ncbi:RecQ family ATP-dependent DNA helicase [Alkalihalobacillus trypoxylicola]|uniref:ATP-dependent DNA helicase RecQ n=1 Tax=Alkalihalobacillus trypoxylicola TaxID=519424 RepID=A0A162EKR7_9BACI|nr:ATP-dependent DNA helicase RecQ [Alkalihalobacillus trypoxylicola]KYG33140.1 ATP-dependent DNA helicase [Alkalihalobacillus trypoxylicola]GAF65338.1 ATP-dependent DNA helicase [Bacillus sp. TS-2]
MDLSKALNRWFGYQTFREGQKEIITSIMNEQHVLAMLPTGTGKSICYQLPALLADGVTIIVSPLLSLMENQVQELKTLGIKNVVAINSFLNYDEKNEIFRKLSTYKMIYLSPEMLQSERLIARLMSMKVSYFIIDEAHCISQWGHDFRPDYIRLSHVIAQLNFPPTLAITATATEEVRKDIIQLLHLRDVKEHIYSVDRRNIALRIEEFSEPDDKWKRLINLVEKLEGPGMIYFSSRKSAERATRLLQQQGQQVSYYHGGMTNNDRMLIQQQFMQNQLSIICCTNAFGMGINKNNIRYIIHFHPPKQMESYLQEIGRAGRDRKKSISYLFYSSEDKHLTHRFIDIEQIEEVVIKRIVGLLSEQKTITTQLEESLQAQFNLSESTWRVFKYLLEKFQFIENNQVKKLELNLLIDGLIKHYQNRRMKRMKQWEYFEDFMNTRTCRREAILEFFTETLKDKPEECCDICGFSDRRFWKRERNHVLNADKVQDWQQLLKKKLLQV